MIIFVYQLWSNLAQLPFGKPDSFFVDMFYELCEHVLCSGVVFWVVGWFFPLVISCGCFFLPGMGVASAIVASYEASYKPH